MTKEERKEYQRQWRIAHKDEIKAYHQQYYKAHIAEHKEQSHSWYMAHRDEAIDAANTWAKEHPERRKANSRRKHRNNELRYTTDWEHVEGYDRLLAAGLDVYTMNNSWHVHHRFEDMGLSVADLKEMNLYYDRPACELIIMTNSEHAAHHHKLRNNDR